MLKSTIKIELIKQYVTGKNSNTKMWTENKYLQCLSFNCRLCLYLRKFPPIIEDL